MRIILWFSIVIACAAYLCGQIVDPDLWWHITAGRWILNNHAVPSVDYWNMFGYGKPWIAYSWLFELIVAWLDGMYGSYGLYFAKLFVAFSLCAVLCVVCSRIAGDWFIGSFFGLFAAFSSFNHFTLRPQSIIWVLFALLFLVGNEIRERGLKFDSITKLFFVMSLWANLHITTAIGLLTLGLFVYQKGHLKNTVLAVLCAFISTLCTPYFGAEWLTFLSKTSHPLNHAMIAEFQPATILQYSTAFLIIIGFVILVFFNQQKKAFENSHLFLCAGFSAAALAVVKFLPFAVIACAAVVSLAWGRAQREGHSFGNLGQAFLKFKDFFNGIPRGGLAFVFLCWGYVQARNVWIEPLNLNITPVHAFDFIETYKLPVPLLVGFGQGGYSMYRYSDAKGDLPSEKHRSAIDGRTNVVPLDVWEKFLKTLRGERGWKEYIELVNPETILWKTESPLISILEEGQDWCPVFRTGDLKTGFSVYIKKSLFNERRGDFNSIHCS